MRKPTLSQIKRLNDRIENVAAWREELRLTGMIVLSPIFTDGTQTLRVKGADYALSADQVAEYTARFRGGVMPPRSTLSASQHRAPLSDAQFTEFCAFVERRNADQRQPVHMPGRD